MDAPQPPTPDASHAHAAAPSPTTLRAYVRSGEFWMTLGTGVGILLVIGVLLLFVLLPLLTRQGASRTVPTLAKLSYAQALERLDAQDLNATVVDSQYQPGAEPLTVITHTPAAGEQVKPGRTVYLVVAKQRPPTIRLPDIIDVNLQQGRYLLETWGLKVGRVSYVRGDATDLILRAEAEGRALKPGDPIRAGTLVNLVVSQGPGQQSVALPDLIGLKLSDATSRLNNARLAVGVVRYGRSAEFHEPGIVYRMVPPHRPDAELTEGYAVDLYVTGERTEVDEVGKPGGN